ncbi:MAG: hypothetical protein LBB94_08210 [Clostridiales bacterium]|jgi:hypothetical protein|nr:hypothetical protein [Clostridiales bacterium]
MRKLKEVISTETLSHGRQTDTSSFYSRRYRKLIWVVSAFVLILLYVVNAYAIQMRSSNEESTSDDVIGQVTITNVDSADNSIRLNGSHIKITDKDTGNEYTDIIKDDGTLVYELPLGSYLVSQALAPENYQLNGRVFEFTLQVPPDAEASNIKVVNASVMLTNDPINDPMEAENTESEGTTDPESTDTPASPVPEQAEDEAEETPANTSTPAPSAVPDPGGNTSPTDKNPVTGDISNILLAISVFLGIIAIGCIVSLNRINSKL